MATTTQKTFKTGQTNDDTAVMAAMVAGIDKVQAAIEFEMDGTIVTANDNFRNAVGYTLDKIQGEHHSMFVDESYRKSTEFKEFGARLNRGECVADEFKRIW